MQAIKFKYTVTILGMLLVIIGCSAKTKNEIELNQILKASSSTQCKRGLISPPGVNKCLVIDDILAGKIEFRAPRGRCPMDWKKQSENGFCLPAFQLIACGSFSFACDLERGDTFKIVRGPTNCKNGTMTVAPSAPRFDTDGELYLVSITVLACGPVGRIEPG